MDLPKKDKNGKNKLSYSQISCFHKSKNEYYNRYIKKEPFLDNPYAKFGRDVENAIEKKDFSSFSNKEKLVLNKVTRLDVFQKFVMYESNLFNLYGYIDTCKKDFSEIVDYKTGGKNKEFKYINEEYIQLEIYAMCILQMTGRIPNKASVEFIRRGGNIYKGQKLFVKDEPILKIEKNINHSKIMDTMLFVEQTARDISKFYKKNKWKN